MVLLRFTESEFVEFLHVTNVTTLWFLASEHSNNSKAYVSE